MPGKKSGVESDADVRPMCYVAHWRFCATRQRAWRPAHRPRTAGASPGCVFRAAGSRRSSS